MLKKNQKRERKVKKAGKIERLTERLFQIKGDERGIATKCITLKWFLGGKIQTSQKCCKGIFRTIDKNEYIL